MTVYPNGRHMTLVMARHTGSAIGLEPYLKMRSDRLNRYINVSWSQKVGDLPSGYGIGGGAIVPAIKAGGLSSFTTNIETTTGTGNLLSGTLLSGDLTFELSTIGNASLIIKMSADGTFSFSTSGSINMTTGLSGAGTWSIDGSGQLSMIVPFEGEGQIIFTTNTDLKGLCDLKGDITPYTELSPQSLAAAVWNALLVEYTESGTMGKALADAGGSGNPWSALVDGNTDPGTMGEQVGKKLLTLAKFLALK